MTCQGISEKIQRTFNRRGLLIGEDNTLGKMFNWRGQLIGESV